MKKKLFVGIAAAALAAVMCVSFAACGEGGAGKAKSIKGEEVTAEQWAAAFADLQKDDAVFTAELSIKSSSKSSAAGISSSESLTVNHTVIKNKEKEYYKETENTGDGKNVVEQYTERESGGSLYTLYDKGDDGWEKSEHENSIVTETTLFYEGITFNYSGLYSSLKYSAEDKGYVLASASEDRPSYIFKFDKEGRLAAIYCHFELKQEVELVTVSGNFTYSLVINYTAKDLTMPTVKGE